MTRKENAEALLRGNKGEFIGLYESFWPETIQNWQAQGHLTKQDPETGKKTPISPTEYFGLDIVGTSGFIDHLPYRGVREILEETDEWYTYRNGAGAVFKLWKNHSGTPEHIDFRMTERKIWDEEYRQPLLSVDDERLGIEGVREAIQYCKGKDAFTTTHQLCLWETLRESAGDVAMFENLLLDPDWIHDFNRVYTDFYIAHLDRLFELTEQPQGAFLYDDLGYKNGLFCSLKVLRELYLPYYQEIVNYFHKRNMPVIFHSCGNIEAALPFFAEMGIDALNPMEVKAGCDVVRFAEKHHGDFAFVGGLDVRVLEDGDHAAIKKETLRILNGMKAVGARYFFGTDHSVTPNVKFEDYVYAVETYRENMNYRTAFSNQRYADTSGCLN